MSVYDAGAVRATADLDRDPFIQGLRLCQSEGNKFAAQRFTATAGLDSKVAEADLEKLRALIAKLESDEVVIKAKADVDEAIADLERLRAEQKRTDDSVKESSEVRKKASEEDAASVGLIRTAIEFLGPAAIVAAGGLAGLAAGAIGLGGAGLLAIKGVTTELHNGSVQGAQFQAGLNLLNGDLKTLEQTTANGVFNGFEASVTTLHQNLPGLNSLLGQSSSVLGDVVQHLVSGLTGGLKNFTPLILDAEHELDGFASYFDKWANGSGGANFAEKLDADMKVAIPAIEQLLKLVENLVSAGGGIGTVLLSDLGMLAKALNALPVGVLQTLLTTYLAFRSAALITTILNGASAALIRFAGAEVTAAAAGGAAGGAGAAEAGLGGLAGRLGAGLAVAAPYAAAIVGVAFAMNQAANATKGWMSSTSGLKQTVGDTLALFDTLPWNWAGAIDAGEAKKEQLKTLNTDFGNVPTTPAAVNAARTKLTNGSAGLDPNDPTAQRINAAAVQDLTTYMNRLNSAYTTYLSNVDESNAAGMKLVLTQSSQSGSISSAISGYQNYQTQLGKNITAEQGWMDTKGKSTVTINSANGSFVVSEAAAQAALKATGGDYAAATGLLDAHHQALADDTAAMATSSVELKNIQTAYALVTNKLQLTTQQTDLYASVLGITATQLATGSISATQFEAAIAGVQGQINNGNTAMTGWISAIQSFDSTAPTAASKAQLMGAAMVALNGDTLGYANTMAAAASANQSFVTDFDKTGKSVTNLKTGVIDFHKAGAAPLLSDLQQLQTAAENAAEATYQHEVSISGASQAAKDATTVYHNDTSAALIAEAKQLGLTGKQADALAKTYFNWPTDAQTQISQLGGDDTAGVLSDILQDLDKISGITWHANLDVSVKYTGVIASFSSATAATLYNEGIGVKPKGSSANGNIYSFYAEGGVENHVAQIAAPANMVRVWNEPETMGEAYVPFAPQKRARSQDITRVVAARLGGVAYFEDGGFSGVTGSSSKSKSGSSSSSNGGTTKATATELRALVTTLTNELRNMGALGTATAAAISSVENALYSAAATAHQYGIIPESVVDKFKAENIALTAEIKIRDQAAVNLKTANTNLANADAARASEAASITATNMGAFDIGTSGNGYAYGITSSLGSDITSLQNEAALRDKAKSLGLNPALLSKIISEGPAQSGANLQAIVGGGAAYVKGLNAQYAQFSALSASLGAAQAGDDNAAAIATAQAAQLKAAMASAVAQAKSNVLLAQLIALTKDLDAKAVARQRQG